MGGKVLWGDQKKKKVKKRKKCSREGTGKTTEGNRKSFGVIRVFLGTAGGLKKTFRHWVRKAPFSSMGCRNQGEKVYPTGKKYKKNCKKSLKNLKILLKEEKKK